MSKLVAVVGLAVLCWTSAAMAAETLIPRGAVWKYVDDGSDQGTAWRDPAFNDSTWKSGPAELGYGDGDEATVVSFGPNSNSKYITTYFRRTFTANNPAAFTFVRLQVKRDDGIVVYLNGTEIYRNNINANPVLFDTRAQNAGDDGANFLAPVTIPPSMFLNGQNLMAVEIHQDQPTSSDISFDLELTASTDNAPPAVVLDSPPDGRVFVAPADISLRATATDPDGNLSGVEFYQGTTLIGSDTTSPYTAIWSGAGLGTYSLYAVAFDSVGLRTTSSPPVTVRVEPSAPPTVTAKTPAPGTVSSLSQIAVTFSEPVSGVKASDLLINGAPATSLTSTGATYTFRFPAPTEGPVFISWAGGVNILDFEPTPRTFDPYGAGATWQYNLTDSIAPLVSNVTPPGGSTVRSLSEIEITFSEPVSGVDPADLRINNVAAISVTGSGPGPYHFEFAQPANGPVTLAWATGHGIRDLSSAQNAFAGGSWNYTLNTTAVFEGAIVINEIMYHPSSERTADEWIELFNRGTAGINLTGWSFSRGVDFVFPNVTIPAGSYLVVAANVAAFQARYPGVANVIGGWTGQLNNTDEDIELEDANGDRVDLIHYFDEGDFGFRRRSPILSNGWDWVAEHDGLGKSLERRNAALLNSGQNWDSSTVVDGTPGRSNSVATNNIAPMLLDVAHSPGVPTSTTPITIRARVVDESTSGLTVQFWWRNASTTNPPAFAAVPMFDDGVHGDGGAGDGVFAGSLSARPDRQVVEFYVEATDSTGRTRTWPMPAQLAGGGFSQSANALFQVDDTPYEGRQPIYRIVMTETDRTAFASQNRNLEALVNATLIAVDGGSTEIRYSAGMRYRGAGSRGLNPPTYRLDIPSDRRWDGRTSLNLNSQFVPSQVLGSQVATKAGLVTEYVRAVQLRINGNNPANAGSSQFGSYAAVEPTNGELIENHLPEDAGGNVYRASTGSHTATLDYRGTDPNAYISRGYQKNSNVSENDWTDLINLTFALDPATTPDNEYVAAVRRNLNVEQWLRYFSVLSLMAYTETALSSGFGDDYGLYRGIKDPRFIVLAHDYDTVFGFSDSAGSVNQSIYVATAVPTMNRFLRHPEFEPLFHAEYRRQLAATFTTNNLFSLVDQYLGDWVPSQTLQNVRNFIVARNAAVLAMLPPEPVTVTATLSGEPTTQTYLNSATLTVGGQGVTHYRYRINGGAYGPETPVGVPIQLTGLSDGTYIVYVIGRDAAMNWQAETSATLSKPWTVLSGLRRIVINEVLARNVMAVNHGGAFPDLVELHNPRATDVDLSGWRLTDDLNTPNRFVFPAGTSIPNGGYLVLYGNNPDGSPGIHIGFGLGQDGDALYLLGPVAEGDRAIDSVEFGFQLADLSIGRVQGENWALCHPTFGSANILEPVGSPGVLKINEWLANGVSPFLDDFIELYNPGSLPVEIGGLYLTDRPVGSPLQHQITPLSFLPAFAYRAFIADGNAEAGTDHLNFQLSSEQGEIGLLGPGSSVIDCVIYGPQMPGISQGRVPNGGSRIISFLSPTPGAPNPVPPPPVEPQYVTLLPLNSNVVWKYNDSGANLGTTWRATGYDDSSWPSGPPVLGFDPGLNIPEPIRTALTVVNNKITFYFRIRFTVPPGLNASALQATHLTDDGAVFYLNGNEAGRFNMPDAPAPISNTTLASTSHEGNNFETTSLALNTLIEGENVLAVEVHQNAGTSSDVIFGMHLDAVVLPTTPSSAGIQISEVLANNQTFTNADGTVSDWVELRNPSNSPVDLAGMSLTDNLMEARRWVFPSGTVIGAAGYVVIRFDPGLPASLTAASSLNTGFGLNSSGDEVYLFNRPTDGGGLLDSVVFGVQALDLSIGRTGPGGSNWVLTLPTPAGINIPAALGSPSVLAINEWMADPDSGEDWFELYNGSPQPIAIGGLSLSDDLNDLSKSPIPALSFIGVGLQGYQRFDADNNPGAGGNHVDFRLSANGESIALAASNGVLLTRVTFGQQATGVSQGRLPDGSSNIVAFPRTATPGEANYLTLRDIVINEALTHTDPPLEDAIEIHNTGTQGVDISGWYLSDRRSELRLFRVPNGTVVAAGGFVVFYEYQFNPDFSGLLPNFALDSTRGDEVVLSEVNAEGQLTGYRATARFGAAENGVSFGRHVTSVGPDFTAMSRRTFGVETPSDVGDFRNGRGATNPLPYVGPIVINEIMYHVPEVNGVENESLEFIELRNVTNATVSLFDPAAPTNTWRLRDAVDFEFPVNVTIPAGGYALVVGFDTNDTAALTSFRQKYAVNPSVPVFGPWRGRLQNSSDNVELYKPDPPQGPGTPDPGFVPYVLADKVRYTDTAPWPIQADGSTNGNIAGFSLNRKVSEAYGNEPTNWVSAAPTPGTGNGASIMTPPLIQTISPPQTVVTGATATVVVSAFGGSPLTFQWFLEGVALPNATNAVLSIPNFQATNAGIYSLIVVNPVGSAFALTRLDIRSGPVITRQPLDVGVGIGRTALLSVVAGGTPPLTYQWQRNQINVPNGNDALLIVPDAQSSDEGTYRVLVSNAFGSVTSSNATLIVQTPPSIVQQPVGADVIVGTPVDLSVVAAGAAPLRYQWQKDGVNLPNATNATLAFTSTRLVDSGTYQVIVTNFVGFVVSSPAVLTVNPPPTISVAATVATVDEAGGGVGQFTITRAGSTNPAVQVAIAISGTAIPNSDYVTISNVVFIPAGVTSVVVPVTPINDNAMEGSESVILTIQTGVGYDVGTPVSANVFIRDDDNRPPVVAVTSPTNATVITAPATVAITATANDPDGSISLVEFFLNGTNKVGQSTTPPYAVTVPSLPAGIYLITAVATDQLGAFTTSPAVQLIVNALPTVSITSPSNGSFFPPPANINVTIVATDPDGIVSKVELFQGDTLLTTLTSAPYSYNWQGVTEGDYVLTARATDNRGATVVSAATRILVVVPTPNFTDMFAARGLLVGYTNHLRGTNTTYTKEPGEPRHENRSGAKSAWISWTAPSSGPVSMNTFGSQFDTVLSIYTGSVVSNLVRVAGNDDANELTVQSALSFNAVRGTSYQIAVDGYSATVGGIFEFSFELPNFNPTIVTPPQGLTVNQGSNATFSVVATGPGTLGYRWQFNGATINGATNTTFTRNNALPAHEGLYTVVVTNAFGAVTSAPALLIVRAAPTISSPPLSVAVLPGEKATFSVTASGFAPLTYQWRVDGVNIAGATNSALMLTNVKAADEGAYTVFVGNSVGSVVSSPATLQVLDGLVVSELFELLPMTNVWKFDASGRDLGTDWRQPAFDDSAWASGPALLGFEDSVPSPYPFPILTQFRAPGQGGPITAYFRTRFPYTIPVGTVTLFSENLLDDGAAYFLNGTEIGRLRLAANATNFTSLATNVTPEGRSAFLILNPAPLLDGENVLAVEVHQSSTNSSDAVFGMALSVIVTVTNQPVIIDVQRVAAGRCSLTLSGIAGRTYALDSAPTAGAGAPWTSVVTFSNFTGQATYIDTPPASRFYRGRLVK
jgi:hypothetical protein